VDLGEKEKEYHKIRQRCSEFGGTGGRRGFNPNLSFGSRGNSQSTGKRILAYRSVKAGKEVPQNRRQWYLEQPATALRATLRTNVKQSVGQRKGK